MSIPGIRYIFLLEITWNNRIHRFSTRPIRIYDDINEQDLQFIGTLNTPEFVMSSNFFGLNLDTQSIPFEVIFDNEDLVKARFEGRVLDNSLGILSYVEINEEVHDIPVYQSKTIIFKGRISQPIIGDVSKPIGYCSFSLEQGVEIDDFIIDSTSKKIPSFGGINQGKNIPLVFGYPGKNIKFANEDGYLTEQDFSVTPAYLFKNDTGDAWLCISYGIVEAGFVYVSDSEGNNEPGVQVEQRTIAGTIEVMSYVNINGSSLTISEDSNQKYFVSWQYSGGGLNNPFGTGALEGGADIIRYVLSFGKIDIDYENFDSVAPILNGYKFSGYINQPSQGMSFLTSEILPYLPCEITYGLKGIKIIIPLLFSNLYQTPQYHIIENSDFRFEGALISQETPSEIINYLDFQFAYSLMTEQFISTISINPTLNQNTSFDSKTTYSDISFNRYGLKRQTIQAAFIHDFQTAVRVAQNIIRRKALGTITLEAHANLSFGDIEIGDILQITSESFHLEQHNVQVIEKKYVNCEWVFTLVLEDNPVQNQ